MRATATHAAVGAATAALEEGVFPDVILFLLPKPSATPHPARFASLCPACYQALVAVATMVGLGR